MLYNVNRGKNVPPLKAQDLAIGEFEEEDAKQQSVEDHVAMVEALAAATKAKRVKRDTIKKDNKKGRKQIG